ncbi:MAG: magnesium chelatase, partial [Spirulinaceae cyanobacterium RM2_2_10]|nr:magnesium chelatase [Spirulinaceae cyanobacterium RM2_2_10]
MFLATVQGVRDRIAAARNLAGQRFQDETGVRCNAEMRTTHIRQFCALDEVSRQLLEGAIRKLGLSARAVDRALKVARTIADLANENRLSRQHLAEAIQYRTL